MKLYFSVKQQLVEINCIERKLFEVIDKLHFESYYPERIRLDKEFQVLQNIYSSYCIQPLTHKS